MLLHAQEFTEEILPLDEIFPITMVLEAAVHAPSGFWRPDWPFELPPDAFDVRSREISLCTLETKNLSLTFSLDDEGKLKDYPIMVSGVIAQASLIYKENMEVKEMLITFPSGDEMWKMEFLSDFSFLEFEDSFPFLVRASRGDNWYFIYFSKGKNEIIETWYDEEGNALGAFGFSLSEINYNYKITGIRDFSHFQDYKFFYDSRGLLTESNGPDGLFKVLYFRDSLCRYWERRPFYQNEEETTFDAGNFSFQWDEGNFLQRISGDDPFVDYRFEYKYDETGNWIERQETRMVKDFGLLFPLQGATFKRKLEYK
jgi:hypothetical protein